MLTWLLIAFTIALIFGVIQIDQLKQTAEKIWNIIQHYLNNLQKLNTINNKSANTPENKKNTTQTSSSDK